MYLVYKVCEYTCKYAYIYIFIYLRAMRIIPSLIFSKLSGSFEKIKHIGMYVCMLKRTPYFHNKEGKKKPKILKKDGIKYVFA